MRLDFEVQERYEWHYALLFKCSRGVFVRASRVQTRGRIVNSKTGVKLCNVATRNDFLLFPVCNPVFLVKHVGVSARIRLPANERQPKESTVSVSSTQRGGDRT